MIKPQKLREQLSAIIPYFKNNPEQLQLFYSNGKVRATGANSISYEYSYDLEIIVTDFPEHPDLLFVPVMDFVKKQQPELIYNPENKNKITFEIDPNNHETHDIFVKIPIIERVIVKQENNQYSVTHAEEPQMQDWQEMKSLTIFVKGENVYERTATDGN